MQTTQEGQFIREVFAHYFRYYAFFSSVDKAYTEQSQIEAWRAATILYEDNEVAFRVTHEEAVAAWLQKNVREGGRVALLSDLYNAYTQRVRACPHCRDPPLGHAKKSWR